MANVREDLTAEELDAILNAERSDKNNTTSNTSIKNKLSNDSSIGFYKDKNRKFLTYFMTDNDDPEIQILVSNANLVFGYSTEIITSTPSTLKE